MTPVVFSHSCPQKPKITQYAIVRTAWGFCAFVCSDSAVTQFIFPQNNLGSLTQSLNTASPTLKLNHKLLPRLQRQIIRYFDGQSADFDCTVTIPDLTPFAQKVLKACSRIAPGQTLSYHALAVRTNSPNAARAVGQILAANPIPLLIPCHRVIRSDGSPGGFMGLQNNDLKQKLLAHESACY